MNLVRHQDPQQQAQPSSGVPILAVALLSIMGTFLLLASYYMFVAKCCSAHLWHLLLNPLRSPSILPSQQHHHNEDDDDDDDDDEDSFIALSLATTRHRGLAEAEIRDMPSFRFGGGEAGQLGCVVCLSEFQVRDTLRALPNCSHAFHSDCIDVWLQSNPNCPLCRTSISLLGDQLVRPPLAPSSSPQAYPESLAELESDEDFVVIELGGREEDRERVNGTEVLEYSPREMEIGDKAVVKNKCHHVSIMGKDDDRFCVQPMRRSFSLDSVADRQLCYSTISEIMFRKNDDEIMASSTEEGRARRLFFAFRHGRGSRNAVVPFEM